MLEDGLIQLVSCLIAAAQRNRANYLQNRPTNLVGTLIKGDRMYICSAIITDEYLDELTSGLPDDSIRMQVIRYPNNTSLSFANREEMKTIFDALTGIRKYGLSIQPSYDNL